MDQKPVLKKRRIEYHPDNSISQIAEATKHYEDVSHDTKLSHFDQLCFGVSA